jgi:hypothetical protein
MASQVTPQALAELRARLERSTSTGETIRLLAELARAVERAQPILEAERRREADRKRHVPRHDRRPRCYARCRDGHLCEARVVVTRQPDGTIKVGKRCRMHGGITGGPKTPEAKERQRAGGRLGSAIRWGRVPRGTKLDDEPATASTPLPRPCDGRHRGPCPPRS